MCGSEMDPELSLNRFTNGATLREGMTCFLLPPEPLSGRLADLRRPVPPSPNHLSSPSQPPRYGDWVFGLCASGKYHLGVLPGTEAG